MPRGSKNKGLHANLKKGAKAAAKHKGIQAHKARTRIFEAYNGGWERTNRRQHAWAMDHYMQSLAPLISGYVKERP